MHIPRPTVGTNPGRDVWSGQKLTQPARTLTSTQTLFALDLTQEVHLESDRTREADPEVWMNQLQHPLNTEEVLNG